MIVGGGTLKFDQVSAMITNLQNQYPIFQTWDIEQYINFLRVTGLAEYIVDRGIFKITEKGKAFVNYIRLDMMYAGHKPL
jgi:hypothetical protein